MKPILPEKPQLLVSFGRSQVASLTATAVDFGTLVLLVEAFRIWYVGATAFGAFVGAVTSFTFGRHWCFEAFSGPLWRQASRYAAVSGVSLLLNSGGVFVLTDFGGLKYTASKVVTALLVGVFFNFPLHRSFVFR